MSSTWDTVHSSANRYPVIAVVTTSSNFDAEGVRKGPKSLLAALECSHLKDPVRNYLVWESGVSQLISSLVSDPVLAGVRRIAVCAGQGPAGSNDIFRESKYPICPLYPP